MIGKLREVDKLEQQIFLLRKETKRDSPQELFKRNESLNSNQDLDDEHLNYFNRKSSEDVVKNLTSELENKALNNGENKPIKQKITIIDEELEDGKSPEAKPKAFLSIDYRRMNSPDRKRFSELVTAKQRYNIAINKCDEEIVDPKDSFYVEDKNFDPNAPQPEIVKKNQSQKELIRTSTLENRFNEMIENDDFDNVLDKLNIDKFLKKAD